MTGVAGDVGHESDKSDLGDGQCVTFVTNVTYVTLCRVAAEPLLQHPDASVCR